MSELHGDRQPHHPERRRTPRINAQGRLAICVLTERRLEARLFDFSAGGFMVRCQRPLTPGSVHQVLIASRRTPADALSARVAYCHPFETDDDSTCFQVGFTFVDIDLPSRRLIDALLEELAAAVEAFVA